MKKNKKTMHEEIAEEWDDVVPGLPAAQPVDDDDDDDWDEPKSTPKPSPKSAPKPTPKSAPISEDDEDDDWDEPAPAPKSAPKPKASVGVYKNTPTYGKQVLDVLEPFAGKTIFVGEDLSITIMPTSTRKHEKRTTKTAESLKYADPESEILNSLKPAPFKAKVKTFTGMVTMPEAEVFRSKLDKTHTYIECKHGWMQFDAKTRTQTNPRNERFASVYEVVE